MRADRLLSLMMLLQREGQMTAEALARELEVSPRTIYRDVEALAISGVPIYANGGPGGGYALLDSYRTTLTGLKESEVQALFMLAIPGPLAELGVNRELQASLLKVTSALPAQYQNQAEYARQRFHVDGQRWFGKGQPTLFLPEIQTAIWQNQKLSLRTAAPEGVIRERVVEPLALVSKADHWYLVCESEAGRRVFRVSRLLGVLVSEETFERPVTFDLQSFWQQWVTAFEVGLPRITVTLNLRDEARSWLIALLGEGEMADPAPRPGWEQRHFQIENDAEARAMLLGFGPNIEIVAPDYLRTSIRRSAKELLNVYNENAI